MPADIRNSWYRRVFSTSIRKELYTEISSLKTCQSILLDHSLSRLTHTLTNMLHSSFLLFRLYEHPDSDNLLIADFGIAHHLATPDEVLMSMAGSPGYAGEFELVVWVCAYSHFDETDVLSQHRKYLTNKAMESLCRQHHCTQNDNKISLAHEVPNIQRHVGRRCDHLYAVSYRWHLLRLANLHLTILCTFRLCGYVRSYFLPASADVASTRLTFWYALVAFQSRQPTRAHQRDYQSKSWVPWQVLGQGLFTSQRYVPPAVHSVPSILLILSMSWQILSSHLSRRILTLVWPQKRL